MESLKINNYKKICIIKYKLILGNILKFLLKFMLFLLTYYQIKIYKCNYYAARIFNLYSK